MPDARMSRWSQPRSHRVCGRDLSQTDKPTSRHVHVPTPPPRHQLYHPPMLAMSTYEFWQTASAIVTVIGLPFAIGVFIWEQRKERQINQEEIYQRLSDEYTKFMKIVLDNADLRLLRPPGETLHLTTEQTERQFALFSILIALFERAYLLVYEDQMDPQTARLWQSWEDYMRDWCKRPDFKAALPELLIGEDESFAGHIRRIAAEVVGPRS